MISLANTEDSPETLATYEPSPYPYGMRLHLTDDVLERLGMTQPPLAGTRVQITAYAIVVRAEAEPDADGELERSVCMQITDMEMGAAPPQTSAIEALFGAD